VDSRVELHGGHGDDRLEGDNAADRLYGDAGEDNLVPDAGSDSVSGGPGLDVVDYTQIVLAGGWGSHTSAVTVNLTKGVARGKRFGTDRLRSDVEGAYTGDGNDTLVGNDKRDVFYAGYGELRAVDGRGGNDTLIGSGDDDDLRGSDGDDILVGDFGDDHLDGGTGVNQLDGGAGTDVCLNPSTGTACELAMRARALVSPRRR